jgi:hypothetical protein
MDIIDPGHIYDLTKVESNEPMRLTFVKRSGGAVQYEREWPGIQTQAVMRAVIEHLHALRIDPGRKRHYSLWQLGSDETQDLILTDYYQLYEVIDVLLDRSLYLNAILPCNETLDALQWLCDAKDFLSTDQNDDYTNYTHAIHAMRMALWCYEARAYRRKQEAVNRLRPTHDDTCRPKPWRELLCDDVPFNEVSIEKRPIGPDGHIVL